MQFQHKPVLLNQVIDMLAIRQDGIYIDCTTGEGGHAQQIAEQMNSHGLLVLIDRDQSALNIAKKRVTYTGGPKVEVVHASFGNIGSIEELKPGTVSGILFDFGISSYQLNDPGRGLSYNTSGRLDMRMNPDHNTTAEDLVNNRSQSELTHIIARYGEERWAKRIAQFIVTERRKSPIQTTAELVDVIKNAIPARARRTGPHPAKRTFQALRIEVNEELKQIETALPHAIELLEPGGRIVTIAYHSLEDRLAKQTFARYSQCQCPVELPVCRCNKVLRVVTRRPIYPTQDEIADNPRARSARLRCAERCVLPQLEDE